MAAAAVMNAQARAEWARTRKFPEIRASVPTEAVLKEGVLRCRLCHGSEEEAPTTQENYRTRMVTLTMDGVFFAKVGANKFLHLIPLLEVEKVVLESWEGQDDTNESGQNAGDKVTQGSNVFKVHPFANGLNSGKITTLKAKSMEDMQDWVASIREAAVIARRQAEMEPSNFQKLRERARLFYQTNNVQLFMGFWILASYAASIVDAQIVPEPGSAQARTGWVIEACFTFIFAVELLFNLFGSWYSEFLKDGWSVFDAIVVGISVMSLIPAVKLPGMNVLRLVKVFKMVRLFRKLVALRILINAITSALVPVTYSFVVCLLFASLYAIIGTQVFGQLDCNEMSDTRYEACLAANGPGYFGTFSLSLFTFFQMATGFPLFIHPLLVLAILYIQLARILSDGLSNLFFTFLCLASFVITLTAGDSWTGVVRALMAVQSNSVNTAGVALFFVSYMLIVGTVLMQIVVAVLLDEFITTVAVEKSRIQEEADQKQLDLEESQAESGPLDPLLEMMLSYTTMKDLRAKIHVVFARLDLDESGTVDRAEINEGLKRIELSASISKREYKEITEQGALCIARGADKETKDVEDGSALAWAKIPFSSLRTVRQGVMMKKGKINTEWKSRFFVLTEGGECRYFDSEAHFVSQSATPGAENGGFSCEGLIVEEQGRGREGHLLLITTSKEHYELACESAELRAAWVRDLRATAKRLEENEQEDELGGMDRDRFERMMMSQLRVYSRRKIVAALEKSMGDVTFDQMFALKMILTNIEQLQDADSSNHNQGLTKTGDRGHMGWHALQADGIEGVNMATENVGMLMQYLEKMEARISGRITGVQDRVEILRADVLAQKTLLDVVLVQQGVPHQRVSAAAPDATAIHEEGKCASAARAPRESTPQSLPFTDILEESRRVRRSMSPKRSETGQQQTSIRAAWGKHEPEQLAKTAGKDCLVTEHVPVFEGVYVKDGAQVLRPQYRDLKKKYDAFVAPDPAAQEEGKEGGREADGLKRWSELMAEAKSLSYSRTMYQSPSASARPISYIPNVSASDSTTFKTLLSEPDAAHARDPEAIGEHRFDPLSPPKRPLPKLPTRASKDHATPDAEPRDANSERVGLKAQARKKRAQSEGINTKAGARPRSWKSGWGILKESIEVEALALSLAGEAAPPHASNALPNWQEDTREGDNEVLGLQADSFEGREGDEELYLAKPSPTVAWGEAGSKH